LSLFKKIKKQFPGGVHYGAFTLKLCKLNGPNDILSQTCFDQNSLKLTPIAPLVSSDKRTVQGDDHTIIANQHAGNGILIFNFT
jgi:hypothetical protein